MNGPTLAPVFTAITLLCYARLCYDMLHYDMLQNNNQLLITSPHYFMLRICLALKNIEAF